MTGKVGLTCRVATTFTPDHRIDEDAFAAFLDRLVDVGFGVYIASGGSGEGNSMTDDELRLIYEIGVDRCSGKVPVNANPPERHSAVLTIEQVKIASAAGVEVVNVYGPTTAHGYRPTAAELTLYFDTVVEAVDVPLAIAPNPVMGYTVPAAVIADVANRHENVVAINLSGLGTPYFVEVTDALERNVPVHVPFDGSLYTLPLGAAGVLAAEANILPKTFRRFLDLHDGGDVEQLVQVYADLMRFSTFAKRWYGATPRWIKLAMRVLDLPGGAGGPRPPYLLPEEAEIERFTRELLDLGLGEIQELAAAAGAGR